MAWVRCCVANRMLADCLLRVYEVREIRSTGSGRATFRSDRKRRGLTDVGALVPVRITGMTTTLDAVAGDFLDVSCRRLDMMCECFVACLRKLTYDQVWQRQGDHENAVGNLVLHLCGNARQWVMHGVGGVADVRVRDAEFSAEGGMSPEELIALFQSTFAEAKAVISAVPAGAVAGENHSAGARRKRAGGNLPGGGTCAATCRADYFANQANDCKRS